MLQPKTPHDFLKVARQRLDAAGRILQELRLTLEAQYIGGYSVECSLKAMILHITPAVDQAAMLARLTSGATYHKPENLLPLLKVGGIVLTPELAKRMRRFNWTTALRYETGRKDSGESKALLKTASAIYQWAESKIS